MNSKGEGIIFQKFVLVSEELLKEVNDDSNPLSPYERWRKVKHALSVYGFSLMCAQSEVAAVPAEVIVGIPGDCILYLPIKDCFYELAAEYCLPFRSGELYIGEFESRASKDLLSEENYRAFIRLKADGQWFEEHHGKWVAFIGGELVMVIEAKDAEDAINQLRDKHPDQGGFLSQVLT